MLYQNTRPVEEFLNTSFTPGVYVDQNGVPNRPSGTVLQSRSVKKSMDMQGYNYGKNRVERQRSVYFATGAADFVNEETMKGTCNVAMGAQRMNIMPDDIEEGIRLNHHLSAFAVSIPNQEYIKSAGMLGRPQMEADDYAGDNQFN